MTALTADFDRGSNNATILVADTGSLTAWDSVTIGGSGSVRAYSNTHVAHGTLAAHIKNATSGTTSLTWGTFAGQTEHWGRLYLYRASTNSANLLTFGGGLAIQLNGDGTLTVSGGSTTGTAIPLSTYSRLEWHYIANASTGLIEVRTFLSIDSTVPDEAKTLFTGNTGTSITSLALGNTGSSGVAVEFWVDQLVTNGAAFPGPFPTSTVAPTVAGSAVRGSVLYCDPGTWNGGAQFSLAYQWTRNGTNIGGATSASYITSSDDDSTAVGCTVTATGLVAGNEAASCASSNTIIVSTLAISTGSLVCRTLSRRPGDQTIFVVRAREDDTAVVAGTVVPSSQAIAVGVAHETDTGACDYLVLENGFAKIRLENGAGFLVDESF